MYDELNYETAFLKYLNDFDSSLIHHPLSVSARESNPISKGQRQRMDTFESTSQSSVLTNQVLDNQVFYCSSCRVSFADEQGFKDHVRSGWHVYNLKRKVVGLPPILDLDAFKQSEITPSAASLV